MVKAIGLSLMLLNTVELSGVVSRGQVELELSGVSMQDFNYYLTVTLFYPHCFSK